MFKRNLFLQLFLVAALSAIGHTSAGTVDADLEGQLPVATSGVANKTTRRVKGMGMGKGKGKGKGRNNNYDPYYSSGYVVYGKGKGKGNGYGYYGKDKGGYAADDDAPAPTAAPTIETADAGPTAAPAESNPACVQVAFQEEFLFLSADLAIPPSSTDPNEIGTTFIYEPSPLFNDTEFTQNGASVEIPGSQVTGVCTRTLEPLNGVGGGGICQFTIILSEGSSITFGGFIEDFVAGNAPPTLVISGGSNIDTGITGEVALLPLDGNGDAFTGDIFFDAFGYQAFVSAMILVCEVIDGF